MPYQVMCFLGRHEDLRLGPQHTGKKAECRLSLALALKVVVETRIILEVLWPANLDQTASFSGKLCFQKKNMVVNCVVVHAFNTSTQRQMQADFKFEARLVYKVSFRTRAITQRNPVPNNHIPKIWWEAIEKDAHSVSIWFTNVHAQVECTCIHMCANTYNPPLHINKHIIKY